MIALQTFSGACGWTSRIRPAYSASSLIFVRIRADERACAVSGSRAVSQAQTVSKQDSPQVFEGYAFKALKATKEA
jgi:hypothetical protein